MLRNNLPITRILGIAFIGLSAFLFSILAHELAREAYEYEENRQRMGESEYLALVSACSALLVGVGFMLKLKWVRLVLVIIAFLGAGGLVITLLTEFGRGRESIIMFGAIICVIAVAVSFGLLMYNQKINEEYNEIEEDMYSDAIDKDLMDNS